MSHIYRYDSYVAAFFLSVKLLGKSVPKLNYTLHWSDWLKYWDLHGIKCECECFNGVECESEFLHLL